MQKGIQIELKMDGRWNKDKTVPTVDENDSALVPRLTHCQQHAPKGRLTQQPW